MVDGPEILRGDALKERFDALDRWLVQQRPLWRPRPFVETPPWVEDHPSTAAWLLAQDPEAIDAIDGPDGLLLPDHAPAELVAWVRESLDLAAVGAWPQDPNTARQLGADALKLGVRARKWRQVERFCACWTPSAARELVDWCGGKAHLGRTLAQLTDRAVTVVELDGGLRAGAERLAAGANVELSFHRGDAREADALGPLNQSCGVVALHACGGLMNALIRGVTIAPVADVALVPCCFHLQNREMEGTRPLSTRARTASLKLDHTTLRLATVEEVKATSKVRARRRRESAWRLGLDLLVAETSGVAEYTPLGTLDAATLALPFEGFCEAVATDRGLALPPRWSARSAQRAGEERAAAARALAVVRALFRRPIELWLVLDRALALMEAGYDVGVGSFCDRKITPRNLLIRGTGPRDS
jgi:hypothetical protein